MACDDDELHAKDGRARGLFGVCVLVVWLRGCAQPSAVSATLLISSNQPYEAILLPRNHETELNYSHSLAKSVNAIQQNCAGCRHQVQCRLLADT